MAGQAESASTFAQPPLHCGQIAAGQGCLYDFTLNKRHNDQLTVYTPGRQRGQISHIRVNQSGEDFAEIEVVVSAAKNKGLYKKHTYQLHAGAKGLVVTTFFRNENKVGRKISLDDYWKPSGKSGTFNNVRWIDAVDPSDKGSYAVGWLDGAVKGSALIKRPSAPTLKHGESRTVTRFIAVGDSPADAYGNVIAYTDSKHSILELSLRDEAEASSTGSATVAIASGNQLIPAYPSEKGHLTVGLPHGSYSLSITDRGRKPVKMEVLLANSKKEAVKIPLSKLSGVKFKIDDDDAKAIAEVLKTNTTLTSMDAFNKKITAVGAKAIAEALKTNKRLSHLSLSGKSVPPLLFFFNVYFIHFSIHSFTCFLLLYFFKQTTRSEMTESRRLRRL